MLLAPSTELIDLSAASCSYERDTVEIREKIRGGEGEIVGLVAELIRDNACGVKAGGGSAVDGPLGELSLTAESVTIGGEALGLPSGVLQMAEWLRSRPSSYAPTNRQQPEEDVAEPQDAAAQEGTGTEVGE